MRYRSSLAVVCVLVFALCCLYTLIRKEIVQQTRIRDRIQARSVQAGQWLDQGLNYIKEHVTDYKVSSFNATRTVRAHDFNIEDRAFGPLHGPQFVLADLHKLPKDGFVVPSTTSEHILLDLGRMLKQPPKPAPRPSRKQDKKGFASWAAVVAANYNVRSDTGKGLFERLSESGYGGPLALVDDPNNREVETFPETTTILALQGHDELHLEYIDGEEVIEVVHGIKDVDIDPVQPMPPHLEKLRSDLPAYQRIGDAAQSSVDARWVTYHPHGSIAAQIIQMYNALTLAYALDRQLLLPGLILSDAPDFSLWDELETALADRCFIPPLPQVDNRAEWAKALPDVLPFSHIFNFEHYCQETGVKIIELPSCDTMHAYEAVGITFEQAVAVRDRELYYRRITDREAQPLEAVKAAPHYRLGTPLSLLRDIPDPLLIFHTLHGPDRLDFSPVQSPHLVAVHRLAQLTVRLSEGPLTSIVDKVVRRLQLQDRAYITIDLANNEDSQSLSARHLGLNGQYLRTSSTRVAIAPYIQALRQHPITMPHINSFSDISSARTPAVDAHNQEQEAWEIVRPQGSGDGPAIEQKGLPARLLEASNEIEQANTTHSEHQDDHIEDEHAMDENGSLEDPSAIAPESILPSLHKVHPLSPPNLFISTTLDDAHTALFSLFAEYPSTYIYQDLDSSERIPTEVRKRLKTRAIPYGGINGGGLTASLSAVREFEEYVVVQVIDVTAATEAGLKVPSDSVQRREALAKEGLLPTKQVSYRRRITRGRSLIPLVEMEVAARAAAIVGRDVLDLDLVDAAQKGTALSDRSLLQTFHLNKHWTSRSAIIQIWWEAEHPNRDTMKDEMEELKVEDVEEDV